MGQQRNTDELTLLGSWLLLVLFFHCSNWIFVSFFLFVKKSVIIIGAGPAGLAAARQLHNFGIKVRLGGHGGKNRWLTAPLVQIF